ncbi:MAG: hypothetical protein A2511_03480 [Deltaproteobacteria bacterium RIFOXYD12_FULL_50_9]|nr:MAG: hypothetical protein A2511_03480 [Deltaproteobacteria bacterium RIFOXYD12_FULL_50_9]
MKGQRGNPGFKGRLVDKSVEAYILALETINRLSIQYRVETFCYLLCNAWELLLKAKILEDEGKQSSIYYKKQRGKPKRSLSLRDCLNRVMPSQEAPERRNIECIAELRDEAVHLVFSQIPRDVLCLFQAGVINYHKRLNKWFGMSISERIPVGMMSIVYDIPPEQCDLANKRLRRELGRDAATFLSRYCTQLKYEFDNLQRPAEFSIGIEYRLVLTKKQDEADILLSTGPTNSGATQIIEVPKDPSKSHPFRQTEVIEKVKSSINTLEINQHDIQCVNKVHGIKQRSEYFYQGKVKGSPAQYSMAFVDWLILQFQRDQQFFQKARMKAKQKTTKQ